MNYKLIATKAGEGLKTVTTVDDINRIASAIFDCTLVKYPNANITSYRSQLIYNWIMTIAKSSYSNERKEQLLDEFITELSPLDNPIRNLIRKKHLPAIHDFWSLIHQDVQRVSKKKFIDEHYSDAVESAFKEVNTRVKKIVKDKTGQEYDGASLMQHAFSLGDPIIILDDLSTESGKDIQKGYLQIYSGSILGVRNPKAHANLTTSKENAIHFLFLASLLMIKIDDSRSFCVNS
ncbi:MAG: TIGR02391 family protein [Methanoregula sp.]